MLFFLYINKQVNMIFTHTLKFKTVYLFLQILRRTGFKSLHFTTHATILYGNIHEHNYITLLYFTLYRINNRGPYSTLYSNKLNYHNIPS